MSAIPDNAPINRGLILLHLRDQYPMELAEVMLERSIGAFYAQDPAELGRDMAYLEQKKLIQRTAKTLGGRTIRTCVLTPAGMDVASKHTTVVGVEIAG